MKFTGRATTPDNDLHSSGKFRSLLCEVAIAVAITAALTVRCFRRRRRVKDKLTQHAVVTDVGRRRRQFENATAKEKKVAESFVPSDVAGRTTERRLSSDSRVRFKRLEFLECIGSGSFKTVYHGKWGSKHVAIAHMQEGSILLEARLLNSIPPHSHLLTQYWWSVNEAGDEYLITELLPLGSLDCVLRKRQLTIHQKLIICLQICRAMQHLSDKHVLHRDLAARNILVQNLDPVNVKVSDFGLAKRMRSIKGEALMQEHSDVFAIDWLPPEVLTHRRWSEKSDVWALGITMWEIFTDGREPYAHCRFADEIVDDIIKGNLMQKPIRCPQEIYSIMLQCWKYHPEDRPRFSELVQLLEMQSMMHTDSESPVDYDQPEWLSDISREKGMQLEPVRSRYYLMQDFD